MRAHQIMTRPVITVTPETSILEAAKTMLRRHVSGLPVVDAAGKLVGIVSEGDFIHRGEIGTPRRRSWFMRFILGPGQAATDFVREHGSKIAEIMTADPLTIAEDTPLERIVELMEKHGVKRLPVTRDDKLVGIVSRANLLQAVASLARQVPDPRKERLVSLRIERHRTRRHRPPKRRHHRRTVPPGRHCRRRNCCWSEEGS
jgi:CBS domain-containing protein